MAKTIMEVRGADGQIILTADRVIIHRKGVMNLFKYGMNVRSEIPLSSISSVHFRDAHFFKMGEISFDHAGRSQADQRQNTVTFAKKQQDAFYTLKEKIFEMMQQQGKK